MSSASPLLLETIRIERGKACNLRYHQARLNRSQKALFGMETHPDLSALITSPSSDALCRCRIVYDREIQRIEYLPYTPKAISSLRVVAADIDYSFKYLERKAFAQLLDLHSDVDEIIIEKEGLLTDTTIANIAFYEKGAWYTPQDPLLEGTMRARLIEEGFLKKRPIAKEELPRYSQVALINAMIGFRILNHFTIQT